MRYKYNVDGTVGYVNNKFQCLCGLFNASFKFVVFQEVRNYLMG